MSEKLSPHDLAIAAAQGVAIALNARKPKTGAAGEELLYSLHHVVCGIPQYMFEVPLTQAADGSFSAGKAKQVTGQ